MWVEAVLALIVEGYREFVEWLQSRALVRTSASTAPCAPLEERVNTILDRHARKHVGVALGVWRQGETWTSRAVDSARRRPRRRARTRSSRSAR